MRVLTLEVRIKTKDEFDLQALKMKLQADIADTGYNIEDVVLTEDISTMGQMLQNLNDPTSFLEYNVNGTNVDYRKVVVGLNGTQMDLGTFTIEGVKILPED